MSSKRPHPAALDPQQLLRECDVTHSRASGPGGQHRNKVQTAVELTHRPTGVTAGASERRSQAQNRRVALFRLRIRLALTVREPGDARNAPSDRWQRRRSGRQIRVNAAHDDYPALLAEALDVIAAADDDVKAAAERLGVSMSQLLKLVKLEPTAMQLVNQQRQARGMPKLR